MCDLALTTYGSDMARDNQLFMFQSDVPARAVFQP